jgi:hypothetical protein
LQPAVRSAKKHDDFAMPYGERHLLSIRFEGVQRFQSPNWSTPTLTLNSSAFGQVSAGAMRVL